MQLLLDDRPAGELSYSGGKHRASSPWQCSAARARPAAGGARTQLPGVHNNQNYRFRIDNQQRTGYTLCARCHGLVHDEYLFVSGTGRRGFELYDRRGRDLDEPLRARGLRGAAQLRVEVPPAIERAPARAAARSENSDPVAAAVPAAIPDVIDVETWKRDYAHLFEWSPDGKTLRPRRSALTPRLIPRGCADRSASAQGA